MRRVLLVLGLMFLLAACPKAPPPSCPPPRAPAPAEVKPPPAPMVPDVKRSLPALPFNAAFIHVDLAFSPEERAHIRNAATAWSLFSMGRARLVTVDDLDMDTVSDDAHRILKIKSDNHALVDSVDAQHPGYRVLAFTHVEGNPWAARRIYVISDRVDQDQFMWIMAHEMGHFLGLDDLDTTGDVMSGVGRFRTDWFTVADLRECQAAKVCP